MRGRAGRTGFWLPGSALIAIAVVAPIGALAIAAAGGSLNHWLHLAQSVLPAALRDTSVLLAGVGLIVITLGTACAWLVTAYDFPGRRALAWALLLPLAMPTYIIAYAYLDLLHPIGPVQTVLREWLGYTSPRQFRLPDIRSMTGCIVLLGFVLYPYVYITVRAVFLMQAASLVEAARTLGTRPLALFRRVALPMARPAIAVGASLALMEALNDVGASEFLGVRTLTVAIYTTWITRSDLAGAAQLALAMISVVVILVVAERWARKRQRYAATASAPRRMQPIPVRGVRGLVLLVLGSLPVWIGFVAPVAYLVHAAVQRVQFAGFSPYLLKGTITTISLALAATLFTVVGGLIVAYAVRVRPGRPARALQRVASLGYAVPGTVLAIGLLSPLMLVDGLIADVAEHWFGVSMGLVILGSGAAIVLAYAVRFLAIPAGSVDAGLSRVPVSLDAAARTLGHGDGALLRRVHLPLLRPALAAAALLVFVDCMKELPATLLLRPLNVDTLATLLYAEAARGAYEDGAVAALLIVLAGLLPVALLSRVGEAAQRRQPVASPSADVEHLA
ncbi:iron ABC transporter permease [Achromobacter sp. GG226]|uniref:ABC transporter permease n=1 Tax=Verticiella alkaliphila TaxID=2779529 RepID=UPI001C0E5F1D|nr:iron ABC transporter permease [Verticiella sp. GG226]MBU4610235.1 iron ABC transporter permease [Verticiella sp. GG226]